MLPRRGLRPATEYALTMPLVEPAVVAVIATSARVDIVSVCVAVSERIAITAVCSIVKPWRCVDGRYTHGPFVRATGATALGGAGLVSTWFGTVPLRHAASSAQAAAAIVNELRNIVGIVKGEDSLGL